MRSPPNRSTEPDLQTPAGPGLLWDCSYLTNHPAAVCPCIGPHGTLAQLLHHALISLQLCEMDNLSHRQKRSVSHGVQSLFTVGFHTVDEL